MGAPFARAARTLVLAARVAFSGRARRLLALLFQRLAADEVAHEGVGRVMMQVVWRVPLRDAALLITPMRSAMAKASA